MIHSSRAGLQLPSLAAIDAELARRGVPVNGRVKLALADDPDDLPALTRMAGRLEPEARRAFLAAVAAVDGRIDQAAVERAVAAGDLAAVEDALQVAGLDEALRARLLAPLRTAFGRGGEVGVGVLEAAGISMRFDLTNPLAVEAARRLGAARITGIAEETRSAIRTMTAEALAGRGGDVRDFARQLRSMVGLTERQGRAVVHFEARLLESGVDAANASRRAGRYAEAQVRLRAVTIARTETLTAANAGQREAWEQAASQGLLDRERTRRVWIATLDDRLDTEICEPLDGAMTGLDEPFPGGIMDPPAHVSCRCSTGLVFS